MIIYLFNKSLTDRRQTSHVKVDIKNSKIKSKHSIIMFTLVCRRLQRKKEKSTDRKRQRREDECGGFAHLQGKICVRHFKILSVYYDSPTGDILVCI